MKAKSSRASNEPIVLSGRVYLSGILADDMPRFAMPAKLMVGDIRLHNVMKGGNRQRFGQPISFAGFVVASVYDGKKFRRLLLRKQAAVESTYEGPVGRREVTKKIIPHLYTLIRRQAIWFDKDHGYEVTNVTVPAAPPQAVTASAETVAKPAPEKAPVVAAVGESVGVTVTVKVEVAGLPAVTTTSHHGRTTVPRRRKGGRKGSHSENQLTLFKD